MPLSRQQIEAVARLIAEKKRKEAEAANAPGFGSRILPTALRVGGGVGGALLGSALAPGAGTIAGGGAGAALGETLAQMVETSSGEREGLSPTGIAIEGALGAIPLTKAKSLLGAAKQGALLAGGGYSAHKVLEEGEAPGLETIPVAGLGALFGAGAHKIFDVAGRAMARPPATPPPPAPEPPSAFSRFLGSGLVPEERRLPMRTRTGSALNPEVIDLPAGTIPRPMGSGGVLRDVEAVASDYPGSPREDLTGLMARDAEEAAARAAGAAPPPPEPPSTALAVRQGYDLTEPLDLAPPVFYQNRPIGLLPARTRSGSALEPPVTELPAGTIPREVPSPPISPAEPIATDVVGSPRGGLTGLFASQNARLRAKAPRIVSEGPEIPTTPRSTEPEISQPGPSPAAGAPETASPEESALLQFLKGQSRGATLAQLKKKFGPRIEAVVEKLAQNRKLSWGGKAGNERFSVSDAAGFVGNEAQQMLAGGVAGGAIGATQGETPEERVTYGLLGAGAGAAGGAQLAKFLERRRLGPNPSKVAEAILGPAPATEAAGPKIPAARSVQTDKRIPVIGGQKLTAAQGNVPIAEITEPVGAPIAPGRQPKARYEQAGFNLKNFNPALRPFIQERVIDDAMKAAAETQRRGQLSIAYLQQRAQQYAARLDKPLKPGTTILPEELMAISNMEASLQLKARDLWATATQTGQLEDRLRAMKALEQSNVLSLGRIGASAEAGRSLRVLQDIDRLLNTGQRLVREAQKQGRLTKALGEFDKLMASVPEDPTEAAKFLAGHMEAGTFDKLTSYFMANILSAIPSFVRNGIGSAVNSVGRLAVKGALAGPIDALISRATGRPRAIYSSEILHEIAGMSFAVREGISDAFSTYRNGFSTRAINEGMEFGELNLPKIEFQGGLLNPWNQPGRILESTDRFFQTFNQTMARNGLAWSAAQREADKFGLVGQKFDDFMTKRVAELLEDNFIRGQAVEAGRETAFREDPGKIANTIIGLKQQAPVLNFIVPFVKTVSNIFRQGIEHSPFAPVLSRTREKMMPNLAGMSQDEVWMAQREQATALAKWAFGLASTVPIAAYAATGKLSGSGPSDQAKRAALYEQGWRPNSIQIGDKWYNYSTWQPISIPMAMIANAFEAYEDSVDSFSKEGKETDWEKVAAATAFKVLNSATQQSYMQGVMALSAAMEDPDQFAEQFLRQTVQGFYPLSGLQRTIARGVDPTIRENRDVQESLQRITPGVSQGLPSRLNRWGEDVTYSGGPLWRAVGGPVFGGEGGKQDPVNDELMRLGIDVGLPTERIVMGGKRVELQRQQGHELRQIKGQLVRDALERVMFSAGYAELPDELRRERLEDTLSRVSRRNSREVRLGMQGNPSDFLSLLRERAANRE